MTETTNFKLKKIDQTDEWRQIFADHNDSMDRAETALTSHNQAIAKLESCLNSIGLSNQNGVIYIAPRTSI